MRVHNTSASMKPGSMTMTDGRKIDPKIEGEGGTRKVPSARQPARRPAPSTATPPAARRGRTRYTGLQWMLAVGSIAAVVVGANGLAQSDALAAASDAEMTLAANELVGAPPVAQAQGLSPQRSSIVAVAPAVDRTTTLPGLAELPSLDLPPILTVPTPQLVQPQVQQVLPARPAARSRSSR